MEWHPRVSGLRVRAGLQGADVGFASFTSYSGFVGPAPVSLGLRSALHSKVPYQAVFSGEYTRRGLRLSAEYMRGKVRSTAAFSGLPVPLPASTTETKPTSTYGQAAYRFNERLQASAYYSVYYVDAKDKKGLSQAARGRPASNAWVKDFAFTLRVDLNRHWLAKAEVHRFDGTANLSVSENPEPLTQKWTLFAVKSTLHF